MTVKHLTYLDLTPEQRVKAANESRMKIRNLLSNPFITPQQAEYLSNELTRLGHWERVVLPVSSELATPSNSVDPADRPPHP